MGILSPLRKDRITATRARDILTSHFNTPAKVMREMVRESLGCETEFKGNVATEWGINNEETAAAAYEVKTGSMVTPQDFRIHPEHNWLGASYDYVTGHEIVEIKCPYNQRIPDAAPKGYLVQLRCEIECDPSRDYGHLFYWTPAGSRIFKVSGGLTPPEIDTLHQFHLEFRRIMASKKLQQQYIDPLPREDSAWREAVWAYREATEQKKFAEELMNEAKIELDKLADGMPQVGFDLKVNYSQRRGSVDYDKIPELADVDLDKYRKKGTTVMQVIDMAKKRE